MRCEAVRELFSEIYDQAAEGQALLMKHIQSCEACMEEYQAYSQMLDELRDLPVPELPPGFHESAMIKIQAIVPPSSSEIDDLLEEIENRKRLRDAKRKSPPVRRTASITRRWAGVAAAACLLLASIWAVHTLSLPERHTSESDNHTASQAVVDNYWDMNNEMPVEAAVPPSNERGIMQYDLPVEPESANEQDFLSDYPTDSNFAMPQATADDLFLEDIEPPWNMHDEDNAHIDFAAEVAELEQLYDEIWADDLQRRVWGLEYGESDYASDEDAAFAAGGPAEVSINMLADDIIDPLFIDPPLVHGGEGSRAWVIAIFAGVIPLCIALGFVLRSIHKNKVKTDKN